MAHPLAGQVAPVASLTDIPALLAAYRNVPDINNPTQRVAFGTSGHRGSALNGSFNEAHILAIAQAVAEYRAQAGINGPLFLGKDTHALSDPAQKTTLEVLAANGVLTHLQANDGYTPTPVISRAIHRHHAVAQSPAGWRHQVQPAARWPGRYRRYRLDRATRQCADGRRQSRRQAAALCTSLECADHQGS